MQEEDLQNHKAKEEELKEELSEKVRVFICVVGSWKRECGTTGEAVGEERSRAGWGTGGNQEREPAIAGEGQSNMWSSVLGVQIITLLQEADSNKTLAEAQQQLKEKVTLSHIIRGKFTSLSRGPTRRKH